MLQELLCLNKEIRYRDKHTTVPALKALLKMADIQMQPYLAENTLQLPHHAPPRDPTP